MKNLQAKYPKLFKLLERMACDNCTKLDIDATIPDSYNCRTAEQALDKYGKTIVGDHVSLAELGGKDYEGQRQLQVDQFLACPLHHVEEALVAKIPTLGDVSGILEYVFNNALSIGC